MRNSIFLRGRVPAHAATSTVRLPGQPGPGSAVSGLLGTGMAMSNNPALQAGAGALQAQTALNAGIQNHLQDPQGLYRDAGAARTGAVADMFSVSGSVNRLADTWNSDLSTGQKILGSTGVGSIFMAGKLNDLNRRQASVENVNRGAQDLRVNSALLGNSYGMANSLYARQGAKLARGGSVYKKAMTQLSDQQLMQMDAEYAQAQQQGLAKFTSSVTGLEYAVRPPETPLVLDGRSQRSPQADPRAEQYLAAAQAQHPTALSEGRRLQQEAAARPQAPARSVPQQATPKGRQPEPVAARPAAARVLPKAGVSARVAAAAPAPAPAPGAVPLDRQVAAQARPVPQAGSPRYTEQGTGPSAQTAGLDRRVPMEDTRAPQMASAYFPQQQSQEKRYEQTRVFQRWLGNMGYGIAEDAIWGPKSEAAFQDFMKTNGLQSVPEALRVLAQAGAQLGRVPISDTVRRAPEPLPQKKEPQGWSGLLTPRAKFRKGGVFKYAAGGAVILGGQRHSQEGGMGAGNPVLQGGQKVAETEAEELLLTLEQTTEVEGLIAAFDETQDPQTLAQLGALMRRIITQETEDLSGTYKQLS